MRAHRAPGRSRRACAATLTVLLLPLTGVPAGAAEPAAAQAPAAVSALAPAAQAAATEAPEEEAPEESPAEPQEPPEETDPADERTEGQGPHPVVWFLAAAALAAMALGFVVLVRNQRTRGGPRP